MTMSRVCVLSIHGPVGARVDRVSGLFTGHTPTLIEAHQLQEFRSLGPWSGSVLQVCHSRLE